MAATAAVLNNQLSPAKDLIHPALRRLTGIAGYDRRRGRGARGEYDDRKYLPEIPRRA
jgi:hypothetical protein